jgi:hypothetical protein
MISTLLLNKNMRLRKPFFSLRVVSKEVVGRLLLLASAAALASAAQCQPLVLEQRIELPMVKGRLDHMAFDEVEGRLFVAAVAADSVEIPARVLVYSIK